MEKLEILRRGSEILNFVLCPHDFHFGGEHEGKSLSLVGGGPAYARGQYVRRERRIDLMFHWSLGPVTYQVGELSLAHEPYLRALGIQAGTNAYPGFFDDPLDGFRHLKTDLERFGQDFLVGDAAVFLRAATEAAARESDERRRDMARAVGDQSRRRKARELFHAGKYKEVIIELSALQYPDLMDAFERKILEVARRRAASQ